MEETAHTHAFNTGHTVDIALTITQDPFVFHEEWKCRECDASGVSDEPGQDDSILW